MKKLFTVMVIVMIILAPLCAKEFKPKKDVTWTCTSKPGGGSDIFSQAIRDAAKANVPELKKTNIVISYVTDGAGEVGRLNVANTAKAKADYTLLTFNSGDLMPMVKNTANRIQNFTPLAVMAVDKQLLFVSPSSSYKSFKDVIDAVKGGKSVVIAGSKGDDIETYNALIKELGFSENQLKYIANDATSGAITNLLGGHVDICMSKPAAASEYVKAGKMVPILALSNIRYNTPELKDAPILSELGYKDVEVPVWRGVVGPKAMSKDAAEFWVNVLTTVSKSKEWNEGYIAKNGLLPQFMGGDEAKAYMTKYQEDYLKKIGK